MKENSDLKNEQSRSLEAYTQGDSDFKRELVRLILKNLDELKLALNNSIRQTDSNAFAHATHKSKTTLVMLGDEEYIGLTEDLNVSLSKGVFGSIALKEKMDAFLYLTDKIYQGLEMEYSGV